MTETQFILSDQIEGYPHPKFTKTLFGHETQEKELVDARAEIEVLEKEIIDREIEKESLESIIAEKDVRLRELERKATTSLKRVEHLEPELDKMEEKYTREKDRLGKVFSIAEELDNDLRLAVAEMSARDTWYMDHMALFEDLNKAIKERYELIERAVEDAARWLNTPSKCIRSRQKTVVLPNSRSARFPPACEQAFSPSRARLESEMKSSVGEGSNKMNF